MIPRPPEPSPCPHTTLFRSNDGTDRACVPDVPACAQEDPGRVYVGGTAENGCHRSDVAEVNSANFPVAERVNIACSGGQRSEEHTSELQSRQYLVCRLLLEK